MLDDAEIAGAFKENIVTEHTNIGIGIPIKIDNTVTIHNSKHLDIQVIIKRGMSYQELNSYFADMLQWTVDEMRKSRK